MVREPTMIMAVTLLRKALKTTVRPEKQISSLKGSPLETLRIFTLIQAKSPLREISVTKIVEPMMMPIVPQSIITIYEGIECAESPPWLTASVRCF